MNHTLVQIDWSAVNPTERHFPRTLAEAFADERNPVIEVCAPRARLADKAVMWACAAGVLAVVLDLIFRSVP